MMVFSRSHAVTYTVNMLVCRNLCKMESLLLQTTLTGSDMSYQISTIRVTLSDLNDIFYNCLYYNVYMHREFLK